MNDDTKLYERRLNIIMVLRIVVKFILSSFSSVLIPVQDVCGGHLLKYLGSILNLAIDELVTSFFPTDIDGSDNIYNEH